MTLNERRGYQCVMCALSCVHAVTICCGWRVTRTLGTTGAPVCGALREDARQRMYMRIMQSVKISKDIIKLSFVYLCTCSRHRCRAHKQHQTRCNVASVARERRDEAGKRSLRHRFSARDQQVPPEALLEGTNKRVWHRLEPRLFLVSIIFILGHVPLENMILFDTNVDKVWG